MVKELVMQGEIDRHRNIRGGCRKSSMAVRPGIEEIVCKITRTELCFKVVLQKNYSLYLKVSIVDFVLGCLAIPSMV